jgi:hypothetical protein
MYTCIIPAKSLEELSNDTNPSTSLLASIFFGSPVTPSSTGIAKAAFLTGFTAFGFAPSGGPSSISKSVTSVLAFEGALELRLLPPGSL